MIAILITLIVFCIIAGVLCFVARTIIGAFGWTQPWAGVAYALVCLLLLCLFLSEIGWAGAPHGWRTWH